MSIIGCGTSSNARRVSVRAYLVTQTIYAIAYDIVMSITSTPKKPTILLRFLPIPNFPTINYNYAKVADIFYRPLTISYHKSTYWFMINYVGKGISFCKLFLVCFNPVAELSAPVAGLGKFV